MIVCGGRYSGARRVRRSPHCWASAHTVGAQTEANSTTPLLPIPRRACDGASAAVTPSKAGGAPCQTCLTRGRPSPPGTPACAAGNWAWRRARPGLCLENLFSRPTKPAQPHRYKHRAEGSNGACQSLVSIAEAERGCEKREAFGSPVLLQVRATGHIIRRGSRGRADCPTSQQYHQPYRTLRGVFARRHLPGSSTVPPADRFVIAHAGARRNECVCSCFRGSFTNFWTFHADDDEAGGRAQGTSQLRLESSGEFHARQNRTKRSHSTVTGRFSSCCCRSGQRERTKGSTS
ncbi:hypothetical protein FKP32DRAFT_649355 [Trametes sanguinea]|nr:hypothetical protein FKP32DRAFT_649355 [Trametes sanguinea]